MYGQRHNNARSTATDLIVRKKKSYMTIVCLL
jgi:hypothetical protein